MNAKKLLISTVLGTSLLLTSTPFNMFNTDQVKAESVSVYSSFKDVPSNSFAYDAIQELVKRKIVFGYDDGQFKPGVTVSRGQFATFLARALDLPAADSKFKDLPKSKALYKDVSRAAAAGLIQGDTNGYVYPDKEVSRGDIAVMIDRAMNKKGNFTETTDLTFKDAGSVPKYALESVKRMTKYGIIAGKSNNTFAASEFADRATSSVFVYRMLQIMENGSVTPPSKPENPSENWKKWTLAQLKAEVGEYTIVERVTAIDPTKSIVITDHVENYYKKMQDPKLVNLLTPPKEYFKDYSKKFQGSYANMYGSSFPKYEVISINKIAFRNTDTFPEIFRNPTENDNKEMASKIPLPPSEDGKFLLDLHTYSKDAVTYQKDFVEVTSLRTTPKVLASNNEFMVDIQNVFSQTKGLVKVSNNGYTISTGENTLVLQKNSKVATLNGQSVTLPSSVIEEQGVVLAPIVAVAEHLGLSTRQMEPQKPYSMRVEIANYHLQRGGMAWVD